MVGRKGSGVRRNQPGQRRKRESAREERDKRNKIRERPTTWRCSLKRGSLSMCTESLCSLVMSDIAMTWPRHCACPTCHQGGRVSVMPEFLQVFSNGVSLCIYINHSSGQHPRPPVVDQYKTNSMFSFLFGELFVSFCFGFFVCFVSIVCAVFALWGSLV